MQNNELISLSVCLSDIPKGKMKKSDNGKIYVNLTVRARKEPDTYGNDLALIVSKTKEERETEKTTGNKMETTYCGNGKTYHFNPSNTAESVDNLPSLSDTDDLPF